MKQLHTLRSRLSGRKRLVIAASVGVALVAVGAYAFASTSAWSNYHTAYEGWKTETKQKIDAAMALPATTSSERLKKLQSLGKVADTIGSQGSSMCSLNVLFSWQSGMNANYRGWKENCQDIVSSVQSLNEVLKDSISYEKDEQALASTLVLPLGATAKKITEAGFASINAKWQVAAATIKKMKIASSSFSSVQVKAQSVTSGISTAWKALIAAHTSKDETAYTKALKTLNTAYASVNDIKAESSLQFTKLSNKVQAQYANTFSV